MRDSIKHEQEARAIVFPDDRIAFMRLSWEAARQDVITFSDYANGNITIEKAMERIRLNNYLPSITKEQFLNEYRICGFDAVYNLKRQMELHHKPIHDFDDDSKE